MKIVSLFAVLLISCFAVSAPPSKPAQMKWVLKSGAPAFLQKVIDNQAAIRQLRIEQLEKSLQSKRKELKSEKRKPIRDRLNNDIKAIENEIGLINRDEVLVVPNMVPSSVGEIGMITGIQTQWIMSATEVFGAAVFSGLAASDTEMDVVISGVDTKNWIDDRFYEIPKHIAYCESTTQAGGRTVLRLEVCSVDCFERVPVDP